MPTVGSKYLVAFTFHRGGGCEVSCYDQALAVGCTQPSEEQIRAIDKASGR